MRRGGLAGCGRWAAASLLLGVMGGVAAAGNAEAYQRETYPEVQRILAKVIEGTPQVKTYEIGSTTIAKVARGGGSA